MKNDTVHLIECPRDAMQSWLRAIPTEKKIEYINALLKIGFDAIDFGSFVSPAAVPQMADTKEVVSKLDKRNSSSKLLAIVANKRGAEDAIMFDEIDYLGFPFSISETFQRRNTNSTITQSLITVEEIQRMCQQHGKQLVIYLSMGFGNPYGDEYDENILLQWADEMVKREIKIISLADTVGIALPAQISFAFNTLIPRYPDVQFGAHLHSTLTNRMEKLEAAVNAGCKRFDGALKGIGGCPMAQDELVGNMDSVFMVDYFRGKNLLNNLNEDALAESLQLASQIFV